MKTYTYGASTMILLVGFPLVCSLLFGAFALFILYLTRSRPDAIIGNPLYFEGTALAGAAIAAWTFQFQYRRLRAIGADVDQIASLTFSGLIKTGIRWTEIGNITRIRGFDSVVSRNRFFFEIQGPSSTIYFDDSIKGLDRLLETINEHIKLHNIEAISIDRGTDTLARIVEMISDPVERRKLLRTGMVHRVTMFQQD